jgi:hypothetical protein
LDAEPLPPINAFADAQYVIPAVHAGMACYFYGYEFVIGEKRKTSDLYFSMLIDIGFQIN